MDDCNYLGMYMASIDTEEENNVVARFLNRSDINQTSFWLAATDFGEEGSYRWLRENQALTFTNWVDGSPDSNVEQNCLIIQQDGTWSDEICSNPSNPKQHYSLCEIRFLSRTQSASHAEKERVERRKSYGASMKQNDLTLVGEVGTKKYFAYNTLNEMPFTEALNFCHKRGLRLLTPETPAELEFLHELAQNFTIDSGNGAYFYLSVTTIQTSTCTHVTSDYTFLYSGQVAGFNKSFNYFRSECLVLTSSGFYYDGCYDHRWQAVCELDVPNQQSCGIVGIDSDNIVTNPEPIPADLPTGTEILRYDTYGLLSTAAIQHPHTVYLNAYRLSTQYYFATTESYPNFWEEQGTDTITRTVNFNCEDGTVEQYRFEIKVDVGDGKVSK